MSSQHVFIIAHERSGTHVSIDALRNNFGHLAAPYVNLDRVMSRHANPADPKTVLARLRKAPRVIKSHMHSDVEQYFEDRSGAIPLVQSLLDASKIIYVYRDGRDVLTSLYFYLRSFNSEAGELSFSEYLRSPTLHEVDSGHRNLDPATYWASHVEGWLDRRDVLYLSYRDLLSEYEETLGRVAAFLDRPLRADLRHVVRTRTIRGRSRLTARAAEKLYKLYMKAVRGVDLTSTNFRNGRRGDFRRVFSEEDLAFFDERAGGLMRRLGYYEETQRAAHGRIS